MYLNEGLFSDFLTEKEITWIGIDFSQAKFTKNGFDFPIEILQHFFLEWNTLIISDQKKYDIRLSFRKPMLNYDLSLVKKLNKTVKSSKLIDNYINLSDVYNEEYIIEYVKSLDVPCHTKFDLLFIVESFDMNSKTGAVWVVVLQSELKVPVLCEKFLKPPGGIGTRNYWARVFYNLLFDIKKYAFLRWENLIKSNNSNLIYNNY